jgi:hypothetical protein
MLLVSKCISKAPQSAKGWTRPAARAKSSLVRLADKSHQHLNPHHIPSD